MFVEDIVRSVAARLELDANVTWYMIESENYESIHNHSAYALVEKTVPDGQQQCPSQV